MNQSDKSLVHRPKAPAWPRAPDRSGAAEAFPATGATARVQPSLGRILVVDDRADIRQLLCDYLEAEGYSVQTLGDATEVLARLADFRPQVVLLDILMPGFSGLSALERIRTMSPDVEVIMVTGVGDEGIARQSFALGAYDYVAKPIDFEYLKRCLETCVLLHP